MIAATPTQVADTRSFPSIEGNLWVARITVVIPPGPAIIGMAIGTTAIYGLAAAASPSALVCDIALVLLCSIDRPIKANCPKNWNDRYATSILKVH